MSKVLSNTHAQKPYFPKLNFYNFGKLAKKLLTSCKTYGIIPMSPIQTGEILQSANLSKVFSLKNTKPRGNMTSQEEKGLWFLYLSLVIGGEAYKMLQSTFDN